MADQDKQKQFVAEYEQDKPKVQPDGGLATLFRGRGASLVRAGSGVLLLASGRDSVSRSVLVEDGSG